MIPVDKGRGVEEEVEINDKFAKLSEALYVSEHKAREGVAMRSKVQKEMMLRDKEKKEQESRKLAAQIARSEGTSADDMMRGTSTSDKTGPRDRPVEFEKEPEEADPFGLDQFLTEVKKGKKALDKVGGSGTMKASAGSSMRDGNQGGASGRSRVGFEKGRH